MLQPKVKEYTVDLNDQIWENILWAIEQDCQVIHKYNENYTEFWYNIEYDEETNTAKAVYALDINRTFNLVEINEMFWDYDRIKIYRKISENEAIDISNNTIDIWYNNVVTGGPLTEEELLNIQTKVEYNSQFVQCENVDVKFILLK